MDDRRRWRALAVALVATFMTLIDVSIVNVALPSIQGALHASDAGVQWILSGYALTFGLMLVPAGRVGDARSRRAVFMFGLAAFTVASALCGIAPTIELLIVARLVQGAAGGILTPQVSGLIQQQFQGAERGRAFGVLGSVVGIATAVGPLLGGLLIEVADWRWIFYVNVPVGLVALPLARRLLPEPIYGEQKGLDPVGVTLLGVGVVCLMLPFLQEQAWEGPYKWLLLPLGAAVLGVFVAWERRVESPLVDLTLFRLRSYALGTLLGLVYFAGFTAIFFIFTVYLQSGLSYTALQAGVAVTPFALGSAIAAFVGGRLVSRYGRALIVFGLVVVCAGLLASWLAVELVPGHSAAYATALPLLVTGLGSGLVIAPNQTLALAEVPFQQGGTAGGVLQTGQRMGNAVGIAAVGSAFFAAVARDHGDFAAAFRFGLLVVLVFVLCALVVALVDLRLGARGRAH
ncbi:MFS transporter [Nonomuraea soli]|uniref:EmrB/QacA subfamily drug resistance transporter n=1 Tax=Nonomuraea soli TaxID=1032476 RepID=A0A7W0HN18_9ACTN|nr:MFS transporter [Nonomuraea soli]MBA2889329.1 EmrB/QacA subfamily drug resistance transporter [Nonomuraea soli]